MSESTNNKCNTSNPRAWVFLEEGEPECYPREHDRRASSDVVEVMDDNCVTGYGVYLGESEWKLAIEYLYLVGEVTYWRYQCDFKTLREASDARRRQSLSNDSSSYS